jgi:DNA-binding transcriptional regulator YhcF (GntR family)
MAKFAVDKPSTTRGALFAEIVVDRTAEVPIGTQLAWAVRAQIADGRVAPGMRLPGLRELADSTGVNVNTVRAVYQRLEQEGLIDSQHGSGTFVSADPPRPSAANSIAALAAKEARETGVDPRLVAAALYVSSQIHGEAGDDARERRRLLRAQIATLERTLGEMEATHPGLLATSQPRRSSRGPALLDASGLEDVRAGLVRRLASLQAAIDADEADRSGKPVPKPIPDRAAPGSAATPRRKPGKPDKSRKRPSSRPATAGT